MKFALFIAALLACSLGTSQEFFADNERQLIGISERLMLNDTLEQRQEAFKEMVGMLTNTLREDGSFAYPFLALKRISVLMAPDSSFRIFTGQLYINENDYQYFGILQRREDEQNPIVLRDRSGALGNVRKDVLGKDDWYGAVYYNVKSFSKEGKLYYVLFGYDAYRMFENRKVAEIMHFAGDTVLFGAPVFENRDQENLHRHIIQYSADVTATLNYDKDLDLLIFDNLIPMKSPYPSQKLAFVPDGSYSAYQLDQDGNWMYIDKVFHTRSAVPPREHPVLDDENGRDLFGKPKGNRR